MLKLMIFTEKIENNENQWFALDFILDHLNENQKVKVRKYIRDLMKEEKTSLKVRW